MAQATPPLNSPLVQTLFPVTTHGAYQNYNLSTKFHNIARQGVGGGRRKPLSLNTPVELLITTGFVCRNFHINQSSAVHWHY